MGKIWILLTPVFALLFFRYPSAYLYSTISLRPVAAGPVVVQIDEDAAGDATAGTGKLKPYLNNLQFEMKPEKRLYSKGSVFDLPDDRLYEIPLHGDGYITYEKIGHEVDYRSGSGEILWKREFSSYPVTSPDGSMILMIAGDSNIIEVIDRNGNKTLNEDIAGSLLTDYSFAGNCSGAALSYSDGTVYLIAKDSLLKHIMEGEEYVFVKSIAISDRCEHIAVHYEDKEGDHVVIFDIHEEKSDDNKTILSLDKNRQTDLEKIYPHRINLFFSDRDLAILTPDLTIIRSIHSSDSLILKDSGSIYRAAVSAGPLIAFSTLNRTCLAGSDFVHGCMQNPAEINSRPFRYFTAAEDKKNGRYNFFSLTDDYAAVYSTGYSNTSLSD